MEAERFHDGIDGLSEHLKIGICGGIYCGIIIECNVFALMWHVRGLSDVVCGKIIKGPYGYACHEYYAAHLFQILLSFAPHVAQRRFQGWYAVGGKLHYKRCLIGLEIEFPENLCRQHGYENADYVESEEHNGRMAVEKCAYHEHIYGQTCRA